MTMVEVINNQYGENSAIKLIAKCKSLNISNEAIGTVANFLCCAIDKACIKNDFTKDLDTAIDEVCVLYNCHSDFYNKEMLNKL